MIDLHAHVLPGIDDGPVDLDGALELVGIAAAEGITEIVATPHVSWDWPTSAEQMEQAIARLQPVLDRAGLPVRLRTGAELALTRAVELPDDELQRMRLGGGEWLLVECPLTSAAAGFDVVLRTFAERGHRIVLAHPERSPVIHRTPQTLIDLVDEGALVQITAGSLTGQFGRIVREFAFDMVSEGLVHNIASDAHDPEIRTPRILALLESVEPELQGIVRLADWYCDVVPRAVVDGGHIPAAPYPPPRKHRSLMQRVFGRR